MISRFTVFLHSEAAAFFHSLRRHEKKPLRRFLDVLETYPDTTGETSERDTTGRTVQVKVVGRLKVVYWVDHAVRELKVLRIEPWRRT